MWSWWRTPVSMSAKDVLDALDVPRGEHGSICDSELIARAYLAGGESVWTGSLAISRSRCGTAESAALFCARDLFAVRPFYYASCRGGLLFASSFEALRASGLCGSADPVRVYDALT